MNTCISIAVVIATMVLFETLAYGQCDYVQPKPNIGDCLDPNLSREESCCAYTGWSLPNPNPCPWGWSCPDQDSSTGNVVISVPASSVGLEVDHVGLEEVEICVRTLRACPEAPGIFGAGDFAGVMVFTCCTYDVNVNPLGACEIAP